MSCIIFLTIQNNQHQVSIFLLENTIPLKSTLGTDSNQTTVLQNSAYTFYVHKKAIERYQTKYCPLIVCLCLNRYSMGRCIAALSRSHNTRCRLSKHSFNQRDSYSAVHTACRARCEQRLLHSLAQIHYTGYLPTFIGCYVQYVLQFLPCMWIFNQFTQYRDLIRLSEVKTFKLVIIKKYQIFREMRNWLTGFFYDICKNSLSYC